MKFFVYSVLFVFCLSCVGMCTKYCTNAQDTLYEQTNTQALLKKYEYFKDLSAAIAAKKATIDVYKSALSNFKGEDLAFRKMELLGIIASYNGLVAQYNAAMAKINYSFCNVGQVPAGTEVLPREFRVYETNF